MARRLFSVLLSVMVVVAVPCVAQPATQGGPPTLAQRAQQFWFAGDWALAAEAYAALAKQDTTAAMPRFRFGVALIALGRHAEARAPLASAERLGTPTPQVAFRLALVHTARGALDSAFAELRRATGAGLTTLPIPLDTTTDIAKLRRDARYEEFATAMDRNARPCMHNATYREFDFWLGTWDVRPNGQPMAPPARNVITQMNNGCVVHESWTAPNSAGQSFNIFDRSRNRWFQTWVDNSGGLHEYSGNLVNGAMVLEGEMPAPRPSTTRVRTRLTFTPRADGSVRQFSERTADNGATWQVNYDLIYTRSSADKSDTPQAASAAAPSRPLLPMARGA